MSKKWKAYYATAENPPQWWISLGDNRYLTIDGVFKGASRSKLTTTETEQLARLIEMKTKIEQLISKLDELDESMAPNRAWWRTKLEDAMWGEIL